MADINDINDTLGNLINTLTALYQKFGDLDKVSFSALSKEIKNIETRMSNLSNIVSQAGRSGKKKVRPQGNSSSDDAKLNIAYTNLANAETKLINEKVKNFSTTLKAMVDKTTAYAESVSKQVDKKTKESNMRADSYNKNESARFKKAKRDMLYMSGQYQYTGGFAGFAAAGLSRRMQLMRGGGGITGLATMLGNAMANNKGSWFYNRFGKLDKKDPQSWNINNAFGGLLKSGTLNKLGINAGGLALGGFVTAIVAAAAAVSKFRDATLNAYGTMQKLSVNLEVVYGSKSQANQAFSQIQQYAVKSPFGVTQTTEMAVLLKQSGVYASELQKTLEMIGDVSSGNEEKMKRIANNYAQIQAIGRANMLDMRQFAYAGLPIYEEVAKYMKVSQQELRSMIGEGKVTSEIIEAVFQNMTSEGGTFYKSVNKGAQTYAARNINLEDIKNIALSNWGEWLWNDNGNSSSIAQSFISMKESFWKSFGDWGKEKAIEQDYERAEADSVYLQNLKAAYLDALKENNEPQAQELKKAIDTAKGNGVTEDAIRGGFSNYLKKEMGWEKPVSEREYNLLYKTVRSQLEKNVEYYRDLAGYFYSADRLEKDGIFNEIIRSGLNYGGLNGFWQGHTEFNSKASEDVVNKLFEELASLTSEEKIQKELLELANDASKAHLALAYMTEAVEEFSESAVDSINKLARGSNSVNSLIEKYNLKWRSSEKGQAEEKKREREEYENLKNTLEEFKTIFDGEHFIADKIKSKDQIINFYDKGFVTGERLQVKPEDLQEAAGFDRYERWNTLRKNFDNAYSVLTELGYNLENTTGGNRKLLLNLHKIRKSLYSSWADESDEDADNVSKALQQLSYDIKHSNDGALKRLAESVFYKQSGNFDLKEFSESGNPFIPLWKRILGNATGYDAAKINTNAGTFLNDTYSEQIGRNITAGFVKGLTGAGLTSQSIANMFTYKSEDNKQNNRQIDWKATQKDIYDMLLGKKPGLGETVTSYLSDKQYSSILQETASALQSQISVFEQLKNTLQTTGEDWATINKYGLENSRYFDNAYAGSLEATYKNEKGEEETYNMRFDKELGFVLDDMRLSANLNGKTINKLAKELKDGTTKFTKAEQELIKGLNENTESIIPAIDGAVNQLQGISSRIDFSNKLVNMIANKVAGAQGDQAASFGSSEEVVNMFYNKMLGKVRMSEGEFPAIYNNMADGRNYNPESYKATATALGEVFKQLAATEAGTYEDYKKQYGNSALADNEGDFNKLQQMAADFKNANGDDAIQLQVANELFDTFLGDFERLAKALKTEEDLRIKTANATDANNVLLRTSVSTGGLTSYLDIFSRNYSLKKGNSFSEQSVLDYYGMGNKSWEKDFIPEYTKQGLNSSDANFRESMANDIANRVYNALAEQYRKTNPGATNEEIEELYGKERSWVRTDAAMSMINKDGKTAYDNAQDYIKKVNEEHGLNLKLEDSATPFVKTQTALESLADAIGNIQAKTKDMIKEFGSDAITGTFSELGKAWATGEDATAGIAKNLRALGSGLAANMGQMLTQAGLATIIGSMGKGEKFWTGLAMVAAGAGLSFIGGAMGDEDDDDDDKDYERLLKIKQDLSDLLKQAREDSIYYENTVRHRKALSTNGSVGGQINVNDAIITPSGQVISTHPDDYLIATKTPETLGASGNVSVPKITFNMIDKSTGVKVVSQQTRQTADGIEITQVIENKINEFIATSKGDAAFNARQARIAGKSYVG